MPRPCPAHAPPHLCGMNANPWQLQPVHLGYTDLRLANACWAYGWPQKQRALGPTRVHSWPSRFRHVTYSPACNTHRPAARQHACSGAPGRPRQPTRPTASSPLRHCPRAAPAAQLSPPGAEMFTYRRRHRGRESSAAPNHHQLAAWQHYSSPRAVRHACMRHATSSTCHAHGKGMARVGPPTRLQRLVRRLVLPVHHFAGARRHPELLHPRQHLLAGGGGDHLCCVCACVVAREGPGRSAGRGLSAFEAAWRGSNGAIAATYASGRACACPGSALVR